ncbi:hypothetical protein [Streptomyces sp. NBC_01244]|uniref:hypothetical protein n=1 Tax=Streptomyces sp. NBC_01244 TaxID=2903797 RepID=UPI002E1173A6|nr:hypothetical protein OG247_43790 [Streptomyces sp. NBC_01244]
MGRVSAEKRWAAVERLSRLREDEALTAAHVRTVADALEVSERTVWRWLAPPKPAGLAARPRFELSDVRALPESSSRPAIVTPTNLLVGDLAL